MNFEVALSLVRAFRMTQPRNGNEDFFSSFWSQNHNDAEEWFLMFGEFKFCAGLTFVVLVDGSGKAWEFEDAFIDRDEVPGLFLFLDLRDFDGFECKRLSFKLSDVSSEVVRFPSIEGYLCPSEPAEIFCNHLFERS